MNEQAPQSNQCFGNHEPYGTTKEMLGSGGDYETVPIVKCSKCGCVLEIAHDFSDSYDDGEDD